MIFNSIYVSIFNMDVPAASQAPNLDCYFTYVEVTWVAIPKITHGFTCLMVTSFTNILPESNRKISLNKTYFLLKRFGLPRLSKEDQLQPLD